MRQRVVEEVWSTIEGFPTYAVSNYGRVIHVRFDRLVTEHIDSYGFPYVNLWLYGRNHRRQINHLVAQAFLSRYSSDRRLYPADGDKRNNFVENIRFSDTHHTTSLRRDINPPIVLPAIEVVETGQSFSSVLHCARELGMDVSTIYKVLNGERAHHKGMTFRRLLTE